MIDVEPTRRPEIDEILEQINEMLNEIDDNDRS